MERYKLIVAVDYGTTYTGISFITTNTRDIEKIEIINEWPGNAESVFKVPSKIAYNTENPGLEDDQWGFNVKSSMSCYTWTKLLLDKNIRLTDFDDSKLEDVFGSGMMRLPAHKSAREVVCDYLKKIYEYLVAQLCKHFRKEIFDATPMECWLTVPAIWSDAAKAAGFASRPGDEVKIITEPEAAALAALKPHVVPGSLDPVTPGEGILVCDCGGGTVDITTYAIEECHPKLSFRELCVGIGGKCGSTAIDRHFNQWMLEIFQDAYKSLGPRKRGPGSLFMKSFEDAKRAFSSSPLDRAGVKRKIEIENLNMHDVDSTLYDSKQSILKITSEEMKRFIDPVIDQIISLVESQINSAAEEKHDINRIILVGGFGNCPYLNDRLQKWCQEHHPDMKLSCPTQCQSAVARGAVIRGLEGLMPSSRKARRHYGYEIGMPFRDAIDPYSKRYKDDWTGKNYCCGRMDWVVRKGQAIVNDFNMEHSIFLTLEGQKQDVDQTIHLFCCSTERPPEYSDMPAAEEIGVIRSNIPKKDIKYLPPKRKGGKLIKKLETEIVINMASEQGTLTVKNMLKGKDVGSATIKFHKD